MSRWSWHDRHASPYSASPNRAPPVINDEDYVYLTQDDIVDPPAGFWSNSRPSATTYPSSSTETPDILYVRHRNQRAKLEFPAFTIAEGFLKIGVIRKYAADRFRIDDLRRVKLIYRNQTLRDDDMPACNAELKQNSEITCIITAEPHDDSESSGEESRRRRGAARVEVDGTIIYDDEDYYPSNKSKGPRREPFATTSVQPDPSRTAKSTPYTTGQPTSSTPTQRVSPTLPTPYTPPPGPRNPREKLGDLMAIFDHNHRPHCEAFLASPPSDPKVRATEHTKLSETILTQVLLKLDDVETDGNDELRRIRRASVQEVQAMLNQLDKVGGKAK